MAPGVGRQHAAGAAVGGGGLLVYLLLSRSGPLGSWGILFTPTAMVIAQSILVVPLIAALTRRLVPTRWPRAATSCARWAPAAAGVRC
jgi:ABC-type tungstate transport system substrate-binding protein